jgi:FMN phosphatase YigB (HAD superfamily)
MMEREGEFCRFRPLSADFPPRLFFSSNPTMSRKRTLLITLDAFETLFHPKKPIADLYAAAANHFRFPRRAPRLTPEQIHPAFKEVFKTQSSILPNYGRDAALAGQYAGPKQWWSEVIVDTLTRASGSREDVPTLLVQMLLNRFSSNDGYALYSDVHEFLRWMNTFKLFEGGKFDKILVGVVSNSDDRVTAILSSLGLSVGPWRAPQYTMRKKGPKIRGFEPTSFYDRLSHNPPSATTWKTPNGRGRVQIPAFEHPNDLDLVITSFQAGVEKPDREIFRTARSAARALMGPEYADGQWVCVHAGDDYAKDYCAARDAGWDAYFLDRDGQGKNNHVARGKRISSLIELVYVFLEKYSGHDAPGELAELLRNSNRARS